MLMSSSPPWCVVSLFDVPFLSSGDSDVNVSAALLTCESRCRM